MSLVKGMIRVVLTERQRRILEFEEARPGVAGKEGAILDTFGVRFPRYYQELGRLLDGAEAEAEYPILVHRLQRIREDRRRRRSAALSAAPETRS